MRKAISSTNVVLNMVVSPGVILIPYDMIIIKKKIPGFNNTLTLATTSMKFGVNEDVNKIEIVEEKDATELKEDDSRVEKEDDNRVEKEDAKKNENRIVPKIDRNQQFVECVAGGAIISVLTKIILRLL